MRVRHFNQAPLVPSYLQRGAISVVLFLIATDPNSTELGPQKDWDYEILYPPIILPNGWPLD